MRYDSTIKMVFRSKGMRLWVGCLLVGLLAVPAVYAQGLGKVIQISANVYEYRLDSEKQLGLFYQYNRKKGAVQSSDIFLPGTENVKEQAIRALDLSGSFFSFSYGSFDYNLKTAMEEGRATLINHQRSIVANGEKFSFNVGEQVPLTVFTMQGQKTVLKTEDRPTGIKMYVDPRIFRDNNVLMDLEIESSEITRIDTFDRGDEQRFTLPVITKRNVKTVVIVPSERPVYIGGLYTDNTGDLTRKVPIVGDMPVIGFFLRGFNKKRRQTETIFRITPVIKNPGEGLDIGSSVFEELLQPHGGTSLIQQEGVRETGLIRTMDSNPSSLPGSATGSLMVPSPLPKSATDTVRQSQSTQQEKSKHPRKKRNFSKPWIRRR